MKPLIAAVLIAISAPVLAHGPQKGPNGGTMEDVAGVHAELVSSGNSVTINVFEEGGKPVSTDGFEASALISAGGQREVVKLAPLAPNQMKGDAKSALARGAEVTLTVKTKAGKSGQVKFKI